MTSEELLSLCIRQLEKRPDDFHSAYTTLQKSRLRSKAQFERRYARHLFKSSYQPGDLVLVHNSQMEKELYRKSKPHYLGPFKVVCRTQGGSYVLKEMDGTVSAQGIAAFQLIPYYSRHTPLPASILPDDDDDDENNDENDNENDNERNAYDSDDLS